MAFTRNNLQALFALFFIVVMALSGGAMAAADCNNVNFDLSACNDYFTPDNATVFIQNCCGDLSNVAKTYTSCVCDAIDTLSSADKSNIVTAFTVCNISACNIGKNTQHLYISVFFYLSHLKLFKKYKILNFFSCVR